MAPESTSVQYGGFVSRSLAFVIDLTVIAVASFLGTAVVGIVAEFFDSPESMRDSGCASSRELNFVLR